METLELFLKYIVVPVGAFVWMIYTKINNHHTEIEVLKAQVDATRKEVRENFKRVFEKLDGIEEALRK